LNVASVRLGHEITIYLPSRDVSKAIRDCRAQVLLIDGWESPSFMAALVAARRRGMTVLGSYRSTLSTHRFQRGPVAWLRRMFFHAVDAVLVSGQASADAVVAMGVPPSRIMRIPYNVVDVEYFHREVAKVRAGLTPRPGHHVLYVGQLVERKNVETALEAWVRNRERDDTFTIVGNGPLRNRLRGVVEKSGLQHCVHFRGQRQGDELIEEYAWAQTLVLPSTREVWGLVADEALASGLHVVVSTSTGSLR
jgi:glycosyltransferase involved in cell wall biosynthesis